MKKVFTFRPTYERNMTSGTPTKPPTCCFCCHVQVGTIVYALMHLVAALFCIVIASLGFSGLINVHDGDSSMHSGFLSYYSDLTTNQTLWVVFVNGIFFLLISTFAIYGVVKNRAGFILPFFIVQLFDFLCTMVYIGSVVFNWPQFKNTIMQCESMPAEWKQSLLEMDERWLACIVFITLFTVVFVKSYLISMIYRCYKHITLQVILSHRRRTEINFVATPEEKQPATHIHIYNPPKYDDIQKVPLVDDAEDMDVKPPPYEAA